MPRRGELWSTAAAPVLVVSGDMYNGMTDYPWILVMSSADVPVNPPMRVGIGDYVFVIDSMCRMLKSALVERLEQFDAQQVAIADAALRRVLTTA